MPYTAGKATYERERDEAAQTEEIEARRYSRGVVVLTSDKDGMAINRVFDGQPHFAWRYKAPAQRLVAYRTGCLCGWRGTWCAEWYDADAQGFEHEKAGA
jgi:hypothetical protein